MASVTIPKPAVKPAPADSSPVYTRAAINDAMLGRSVDATIAAIVTRDFIGRRDFELRCGQTEDAATAAAYERAAATLARLAGVKGKPIVAHEPPAAAAIAPPVGDASAADRQWWADHAPSNADGYDVTQPGRARVAADRRHHNHTRPPSARYRAPEQFPRDIAETLAASRRHGHPSWE